MDILRDIGVNIVVALIGFGIGWIWQRLRQWTKLRRARRFWRPFVTGGLQVVVGRFEFTQFQTPGCLGVGDAMGLAELRAYLESLGLRDFAVSYADCLDGDSLKTNLILIGGPQPNAISKEVITKINSTFRFGDSARIGSPIYDSLTGQPYAPVTKPNSGEILMDYGLILKASNPFAPSKQVLLIAGCFGYGTWAGVRFAISKEFVTNQIVAEGKPLECVIETDILRGTPQDIRLRDLRPLEPPRGN